ncbi:MAG: AAA family ATPase [Gemmatales bacterium]|nr:AAA family ATPase [Gemmatales bacterium]MDW8386410.1 AAA family ATPase [Gemmatales bacterium]
MAADVETLPLTAADRPAELPAWYPAWAREMADAYYSGTTSLFILHGNVHDLIRCVTDSGDIYLNLPEFLASQIFGRFDVVLYYDLARGLRPLADSTKRLQGMMGYLAARLGGEPNAWPRDPEQVLLLLDRLLERNLLEDDPSRRKSIGIILAYTQFLAPDGDLAMMSRGHGTNLVRFLSWAKNPYLKRVNVAFCLIADNLMEVNDRLVQSEHVEDIEIPLPDRAERERFCQWMARNQDLSRLTEFSIPQLAELSNGLSLTSLNTLLSQGKTGRRLDAARFKQLKKTLIERQCQGLLEFVEPPHKLDLVVGQEAAKQRLKQDADLITQGRLEAAPMGYLLCGPVGTGKTFLAECYAGSIGIPCVKLRNFRSKYVGETEGNLERVLTVLRSLGPVVVLVDEADAALGTRQTDGDSGTSSRVFAMIANQMGDTRYRGKIIWMLLTSRPDLLPIDLKRQGRAEVHIPLFYPQDEAEFREMFRVMARKNKVRLAGDAVESVSFVPGLSGSDIESILLGAKRDCLSAGREQVEAADLQRAVSEFLPSAQGLEKEMQEIAAVLECTQLSFLPPKWRERLAQPESRARLQERLVAIRQILEK